MADSVVIRIDGDDSGFRRTLSNVKSSLASAGKSVRSAFAGISNYSGTISKAISGIGGASITAFKGLAIGVGAITTAIAGVGAATVGYTANVEQLQTSFEVMTGSAQKAEQVMDRISQLGAETPFEMTDLAETTQLLMNYGFAADDAINRMTMLGDIAQGNADKMNRIATAYGQMSSAGKVSLEDVKQMIEAGFNPLQEISESTGESMASLYDRISKGTLAVDEITAAMQRATSEGGKYYQSMQKQSETLSGLFSTIQDNAQQLGAKIFDPVTDSLREQVLPEAISILDELDAAFDANGFDGLTNALLRQIPRLTTAAVSGVQTVLSGVSKKLPALAKGLLSQLPNLLSSAGTLAGDLTDALFAVASTAAESLAGMLPELVPTLLTGAGRLLESLFSGMLSISSGFIRGFATSLKKLGLMDWTAEDLIDQAFANVDREHVEDIKAKINVDPDLELTEDPTVELNSLYDEIEKALTDGEEDTEEVVSGLETKVKSYYEGQIAKINEWRDSALAGLDSTLPKEQYDQAAAEINAQADSIITNLGTASDTAVAFVEEMAGKPTEVVKANIDTLNGYLTEASDIVDRVAELTGATGKTISEAQREIVAAGMSTDESVQINAIAATAAEFDAAVKAAEERKAQALVEAAKMYAEGSDQYAEIEAQAIADYESSTAAAQAALEQNMALLWKGIAKAMDPDTYGEIEEFRNRGALEEKLNGLLDEMYSALSDPDLPTDLPKLSEHVMQLFSNAGMTQADWNMLAEEIGMDPATLRVALSEMISENIMGALNGGNLQNPIEMMQLAEFFAFDETQVSGIADAIAPMITSASESGFLNGMENVDLTDSQQLLQFLMADFGDYAESTIGKTEIEGEPKIDMEPELTTESLDNVQQEVVDAVEEATTGAEPVDIEQPVNVATKATADESGIQEAVETELQDQTMNVDVNAAVSLNVTVSDSNATAVGTAAGVQLGDGIIAGIDSKGDEVSTAGAALAERAADGAESAYRSMRNAGAMAGTGFQLGLASKRTDIINTARSIANSAARAIAAALEIRSPSRVTERFGAYFGEGFEIGARDSLNRAVRTIDGIVGSINLSPRIPAPDFEGALTSATQMLSDAENQRPIDIYFNGKFFARAARSDLQREINSANRMTNLTYGG